PANAPVKDYWSVTAYDRNVHTVIKGMPYASRSSQIPNLQKSADGSVDIYIGPKPPEGKKANWLPTGPARQFELMFRFYGRKPDLFDKTWKLPEVEQVKWGGPGDPTRETTPCERDSPWPPRRAWSWPSPSRRSRPSKAASRPPTRRGSPATRPTTSGRSPP